MLNFTKIQNSMRAFKFNRFNLTSSIIRLEKGQLQLCTHVCSR